MVTVISIFLVEQVGTLCSTLTGGVGINGLTSAANGFGGKVASGFMRASGLDLSLMVLPAKCQIHSLMQEVVLHQH